MAHGGLSMLKKRIFVIILLAGLLFSFYPSHAQIVHEDPESLPVRQPYDADQKLALSLQEMFGTLDSFVAHVNASDFQASRQDIRLFMASYSNFTDIYQRSNLNGTDMEAIASKLAFMADDLNATVESSELYRADLNQFEEYVNNGDTRNAAQLAAKLQPSYRNVSDSVRAVNENSTYILMTLEHTNIDTSGLESGIVGLGNFTASVEEDNRKPSGLLGNTSLVLAASSDEVAAGDQIMLSGILRMSGSMLSGHLIRFYIDGTPAGSATTDESGVSTIVYEIDGRSFNRTMRASAEFDPQGDQLFPAMSNVLEITRRPEQALLQTQVTPKTAAYADTINVFGTLTTTSGVPAALQAVTISIAGSPAGVTVTGTDGSFALPLTVRHDIPAGDCQIRSSYEAAPDCALMSTSSAPAIVAITSGVSLITLDPVKPVYQGGKSAVFRGTLMTGTGSPVTAANVSIFAGDGPVGVCVTDAGGQYSLATTIPYDIAPGSHDIYAVFDPGEGRALTGSHSGANTALFEPAVPQMTVNGVPFIAFPGDEFSLTGVVLASDGSPIGGKQVSIRAPGADTAAVTDAGGSYRVVCKAGNSPGVYTLSASVQGDGLLSGDEQEAGTVVVMPFDRAGMAIIIIAALFVVSLGALKVTGRRGQRRSISSSGTEMPLPQVPQPEKRPDVFSIGDELKKIEPAITGEGDRREAMLSIYRVARLMLRDRDPSLPQSVTHRELCRVISRKQPSLSASLGNITGYYEDAVFGHLPVTREEVVSSLRSLNDIGRQLYSDGGMAR
jgi:hypothetical protein